MRSIFTASLILASLGAAGAAFAATVPRTVEVVTSGTPHRDLYGVARHENGSDGLAVGDRGTLLVTRDGGASWQRRQLDTTLALLDAALEGDRALAVGQMGLIQVSDDRGETWTRVESGSDERLLGVDLNRNGLAVAVGSFGTILLSDDGGATWRVSDFNAAELIPDNYEPHLNDVQVNDDGSVLIVGEFSLILRSTDGATTWEEAHQDSVSLFGLHVREDGVGYAVGQSGTVLRTTDRGATWAALDTGSDANLLGVWSNPDGTVTVPGMRHMLVSDDSGETWTQLHDGDVDRNWYLDVVATAQGVFTVGHTGRVIRIDKQR